MARHRALLIGASEYEMRGVSSLPFIPGDLARLGSVLEDRGFDDVQVLAAREGGKQVSANYVNARVAGFLRRARPGDTLLILLSGHGVRVRGRDYLVPEDIDEDTRPFESGCVAIDWHEHLDESPAGHIVFLIDTCREGIEQESMGLAGVKRISQQKISAALRRKVAYVHACSPAQLALFVRPHDSPPSPVAGVRPGESFSLFSRSVSDVIATHTNIAGLTLSEFKDAVQDRITELHRGYRKSGQPQTLRVDTDIPPDGFYFLPPSRTWSPHSPHPPATGADAAAATDESAAIAEPRRHPQPSAHATAPRAVTKSDTDPPAAPTHRKVLGPEGRTPEKVRSPELRTVVARLTGPRLAIAGIATSSAIALLLSLSLYGNIYFHGTRSPGARGSSHSSGTTSHGASTSTTPTASIKALLGITDKRFDRALSDGGTPYRSVAFSQDSTLVAAGTSGHVDLWPSSRRGNPQVLSTGRSAKIQNICFSEKGGLLAASDADGYVDVFDVSNKTLKKEWEPFPKQEPTITISPSGRYVVANYDTRFRIMDLKSGKQSGPLSNHTSSISGFRFSPDESIMLEFTTLASTVAAWNPETYEKVDTVFSSDADRIAGFGNFTPNRDDVPILIQHEFAHHFVMKMVVLHVKERTATIGKTLKDAEMWGTVSFTANNSHILTMGSYVYIVNTYNVSTAKKVASLTIPIPGVNSIPITAYAPNGRQVASIDKGYVLLWNMQS